MDAALAAVSAVIEGSCAEMEHAKSTAAITAGQRAGGNKNGGSGAAAQHAAAAGPLQRAGAEQSSQGVSTPAKQPQARRGYTPGKTSARDALAAVHKAAAKRIAQVLILSMLPWVWLSNRLAVLLCDTIISVACKQNGTQLP